MPITESARRAPAPDRALILGIESSCDETAAAVLRGRAILANIVASQIEVHREFGGVVPELASRHHLEQIDLVIDLALRRAGVGLEAIDAVAVTCGPGLVGSLLVGLQTAKAIAYVRGVPLLAVNHLEGHLRSVWLEHGEVPTPALSLIASGGHTSLYLSPTEDEVIPMARTRDDAAGEAFDKVAKLLGLGYPGGPVVDRLAPGGNPSAVRLSPPKMSDGSLDFSFSGFKTAVLRHAQAHHLAAAYPAPEPGQATRDLVASFQSAVVEFMVDRLMTVAQRERVRSLCLSGGVACNSLLRARVAAEAASAGLRSFAVSPNLAVDNAAMIAFVGGRKLARGEVADLSQNADPGLEI
ncbi:MAG TPA: tRNA (adenosine(37)-N6)-threonylcarbamoyltransferase complex transferase subunit TsaD [Candidatus Polarisedimenticolia bacterium]|nr:tRNA (adenosine(37)-N6)-threonylcarbamoyltransferase complex transferase subunit TsaD [Candidatus Polarisedimenticolia bacterium]